MSSANLLVTSPVHNRLCISPEHKPQSASSLDGLFCLQGYAGLHQAPRGSANEAGRQAVQQAVGYLFQALAVFHSAKELTHYGQQADVAASCSMVKHVIRDILVGLTGSCESPGPQVWHTTIQQCPLHLLPTCMHTLLLLEACR